MKTINQLTKQTTSNLKRTSQSQKSTLTNYSNSNNIEFEAEFVKLWVYLESTYANQKFSTTMFSATGKVARAWRAEFKKKGVTPKDLIFFRENLSKLEKPEYIPSSLTLLELLKKENTKGCRTNLGSNVNPNSFLTEQEINSRKENTSSLREECLDLMRSMVGTNKAKEDYQPEVQEYKPTERMAKLIHNHNRLLINQGYSPIYMPRCKKLYNELVA